MSERNYYMVRAMKSRDEDFEVFFNNNVVAVGWSKVNFKDYDSEDTLREAAYNKYFAKSDKGNSFIGKQINEVLRFAYIKEGDYIIVPYPGNIVLAIAGAETIYSEKHIENDMANQRRVTFQYDTDGKDILLISRKELTEGFQRRLRTPGMTVANLYEFRDEIEKIFEEKKKYSFSNEMQKEENRYREKLHEGILNNIRDGKTNLQGGGIGLEHLVEEIMKCEGYDAKVLSKTKFTGKADADIQALREDSFSSKKIYVQVKHHTGNSGKEGIQQIIDVINQDEYAEYEGYFITSGGLEDKTKQFAEENNIKYMDGNDLAELIIDHISDLSISTLRQLGISPYPHMIVE